MSTVKRTSKKNKEQETLSISEFKQWLSGVEDMQADGWVPDQGQWAKIRAKIDCLVEEDVVQTQPAPYYQSPQYQQPVFVPQFQHTPMPMHTPSYSNLGDLGDGIQIPQKTAEDAQMDLGMQHASNQFV